MANVTVYSTPVCPYCIMLKQFLKDNNVTYTEKNVAADREAANEMIEKSGQLGVPVVQIDDKIIIGFDRATIKQLLGLP
jgi:glutaredoxin 3